MLGQLVLVLCFAAGLVAVCILFVLYGPVPVRRSVTRLSRLAPPDPFAHTAAKVVSLPMPVSAASSSATFTPSAGSAFTAAGSSPQHIAPSSVAVEAPRAALSRRPKGGSPPPLPRSRSARGTGPRTVEQDVTADRTLETPRYRLSSDTSFLEDGQ